MSRDSEHFEFLEKRLKCLVCGHMRFSKREISLNAGAPAPPPFPPAIPALCVVCEKCGYVHWFFPVNGSD